jgi:hypothetical protein
MHRTKHIKWTNTRYTLETPVWGKPAKRGFYWAFRRKITAAEISENSYKISSKFPLLPQQKSAQLMAVWSILFWPCTALFIWLRYGMYDLYGLWPVCCWLVLTAYGPSRLRKLGPSSASSSLPNAAWNRPLFAA